ncbi:serine/threonine-protein kinase-like protein ACR4 [Andrographis paniculata]|uniref:serine/threonine-protein kinase-like protein ACR4 n=1 Tax=Andrographis paniculata TaxID=175694 RepID=UPI0021E7DED5|nr:serine/threonine-protein kinase-like protein ACR4 [Andrographis paniculata]
MTHGAVTAVYDAGLVVLSIFVTVFAVILFFLCKKEKEPPAGRDEEEGLPAAKQAAAAYALMEIETATDSFNHRRIIGKGRIGTVYAAVMPKGEVAAVKRIHPRLVLSHAGFGFSSVLKWLSLADHPHVVPITGFAEAPGERIIVMEFGGMLSLDFYLHQNPDGAALLDWSRRLRIAAGAARGLEYLHDTAAPPIIHGCVKPSNILIDVKFCARVCDYGLHFLAANERRGLAGYVDEEYWMDKQCGGGGGQPATKESDVYGFGVVLLELLSGKRSKEGELVRWALPLIKGMELRQVLDPSLAIPSDVGPLGRLARVALACVGNCRKNRPSMSQVAAILSTLETQTGGITLT